MTDTTPQPVPAAESTGPSAPSRKFQWWQLGVLLLLLALLGLVAYQMRVNGPLAAGQVGQGEPAPNFTLQTFDGGELALADLRGQVVVVNFWASWCLPCEAEAAELEGTWRRYQDQGVMFLGIAYADTEPESLAYLDRLQITYPNAPDLGTEISHRFRIRGVPETFVIDQDGILSALFVGPTTQAALTAAIDPLLAAAGD